MSSFNEVTWSYAADGVELRSVSKEFQALFGRSADMLLNSGNPNLWLDWVHEQDRERLKQSLKANKSEKYDEIFRIVLPDGSIRWVRDRRLALSDAIYRITSDWAPSVVSETHIEATKQYRQILVKYSADVVAILDEQGILLALSRSSEYILGRPPEEIVGTSSFDRIDPSHHGELREKITQLIAEPDLMVRVQCRMRHAEGNWIWVEGVARNFLHEPLIAGIVINYRDITRRKETELQLEVLTNELENHVEQRTQQIAIANVRLREAERLQRLVLQTLPDILIRCDRETTYLDISGPIHLMIAPPQQLLGTRLLDRVDLPVELKALWGQTLQRAFDTGKSQVCEYQLTVMAGACEFEARMNPMGVDEALIIIREVTERNRLREQLRYLATHDELTGLFNRRALREQLNALIDDRRYPVLAVILIDLHSFKKINDSLGQSSGDALLKIIGNRIMRTGGHTALTARAGGEEFALVIPHHNENMQEFIDAMESFGHQLLSEIGDRVHIYGKMLHVSASVGIALYPRDGNDAETLIQNANLALVRSENQSSHHFAFYHTGIGDRTTQEFNVEYGLRNAVAQGQLQCLYQPKINLEKMTIVGIEALVRWHTVDSNFLLPSRFIPIAEKVGVIKPVGHWILREAVRQAASLATLGRRLIDLSINVSPAQLRDQDFFEQIKAVLGEYQFPAQHLMLEIAETALVEDMQILADALAKIATLGVKISIDDFGTGYGGMTFLKKLPINELKIDRSFVKGCAMDAVDASIVHGLVDIAHNVGLQVVAVGVERADQVNFLRQIRCDMMQGFFFSMPMSLEDLVKTDSVWRNF